MLAEVRAELGGDRPLRVDQSRSRLAEQAVAADSIGEVAAFLREVRGLPSFVLWGPGEEGLAGAVVEASGGAARVAPATGLPDLLALSRAAALMVSGDTGPLHLAAAAGTPTVSLFGPTDSHRNGPWTCRRRGGVEVRVVRLSLRAPLPQGRVVPGIDSGRGNHGRDPAAISEMSVLRRIARLRVPIGFLSGAVVLWLAHPTLRTLTAGALVAAAGEAIRVWAAGHLEKGREVTTTGPYAFTRHPLYVGSTVIGIGLSIACANWVVGLLVLTYLAMTLTAAVRTEEAHLTEKFGEAYPDYQAEESRPRRVASVWRVPGETVSIERWSDCWRPLGSSR